MEELLAQYSRLDIDSKREEGAEELTELAAVICKLNSDLELEEGTQMPANLRKLYDNIADESKYLDGIYENIFVIKDLLAIYLEKITELYYVNEDEI